MNDAPREARSPAIPLLKAAPDATQIAERLADGPWRGLEIALMPADVADDSATEAAIEAVRAGTEGLTAHRRGARVVAERRVRVASTS